MKSLFLQLRCMRVRDPHQVATYRGNDTWEILGQNYTGSVGVAGGGKPAVGQTYNAMCGDPDSWRNWVVIVPRKAALNVKPMGAPLPAVGAWLRRAARTLGRYWAGWEEGWPTRIVGTSMQAEANWVDGHTVRVYESTQMRAQDSTLTDTDLATSAPTDSDQGAEILAGAWDSGQRYLMVVSDFDPENTYEAGFDQGNISGGNGEGSEVPPFDIAQADFASNPDPVTGYNPFNEYPYPSSPGGGFDPPKSSAWDEGWVDGHLAGWISAYQSGWIVAGGTLP